MCTLYKGPTFELARCHVFDRLRCLCKRPGRRLTRGACMFGWLKRKLNRTPDEPICIAVPKELFPWPKGGVLTAVDEVVIALPIALFDKERPMGEFVFGPQDMELNIPPNGDRFFIRLKPGMSVSLAKSCQAYVEADDTVPRRMKVRLPDSSSAT